MGTFDSSPNLLDSIAGKIKNPFSTKVTNNERGVDFPGGFSIVEWIDGVPQDGVNADNDTEIILLGNMLPFQPFTWGGEQRLVKDYYPGNPEPATQVLGSKESDLTIQGRFKDKRYKDEKFYGVSYQFSKAIDEMRKRGNVVQLVMGNWQRFGFIEKVEFKMNKLSWIDYNIQFFIVGENYPKNDFFVENTGDSPNGVNQSLLSAAEQWQATYSSVPTSMPASLADKMNGLISTVAGAVAHVTNFVSAVLNTAQSVEASANRALGLIKNARTSISQYMRQIDSISHDFTHFSTSGTASGQFSDAFKSQSHIHNSMAVGQTLETYLATMQKQFEAISKTLPLTRYKVIDGDTLQNISVRYYGTPNNWDKIYDHNKLTTTKLIGGQVLEIPKL